MVISELKLGVLLETKKPHPCGGTLWKIVRTGADFKIRCETCGRIVMLTPDELGKRARRIVGGEEA